MEIYKYWLIFVNSYFIISSSGDESVEIRNNGPAILDSSVSFFVKLKNQEKKNYLYRYEFRDDSQQETRSNILVRDTNCVLNVTYLNSSNDPGTFTMKVTVYYFRFILWIEIGSASTKFTITDTINGNLTIYANGQIDTNSTFAVGSVLNFTFVLYDPNKFFQNYYFYYNWTIGSDFLYIKNNSILWNFTKKGDNDLSVGVTGFPLSKKKNDNEPSDSDKIKVGFFHKSLVIKDPIPRINVTGNLWIKHGDLLNLNIFCNGSSPFRYCYLMSVKKPSANFTCDSQIHYDACQFQLQYYFPCCDQHYISIYAANDVSEMRRSLTVTVYDVSHDPTLSISILPIVCVVLVVLIVVAGGAYYKQQQRNYIVEVADFDFARVEELTQKTFFERIYDELKKALRPYSTSSQITPSYDGVSVSFGSLQGGRHSNGRTETRYGAVC